MVDDDNDNDVWCIGDDDRDGNGCEWQWREWWRRTRQSQLNKQQEAGAAQLMSYEKLLFHCF